VEFNNSDFGDDEYLELCFSIIEIRDQCWTIGHELMGMLFHDVQSPYPQIWRATGAVAATWPPANSQQTAGNWVSGASIMQVNVDHNGFWLGSAWATLRHEYAHMVNPNLPEEDAENWATGGLGDLCGVPGVT
jgi:hypothetical protein